MSRLIGKSFGYSLVETLVVMLGFTSVAIGAARLAYQSLGSIYSKYLLHEILVCAEELQNIKDCRQDGLNKLNKIFFNRENINIEISRFGRTLRGEITAKNDANAVFIKQNLEINFARLR